MSKGSLRDQMPDVTAIIDDLRNTFGKAMIDASISSGIKGEPVFWARQNGHEIGTRNASAKSVVGWDDRGIAYSFDIPAGATIDEEQQLRRAAREKANARVYGLRGLVAQGDENAG